MSANPETIRSASPQKKRFRAVAIAAIGMLVILVALDLLFPLDAPSGLHSAAMSNQTNAGIASAANRVMMFSGFAELPQGYSWVTGYAYGEPQTILNPPIPYHSAKQSQVFQTMPILGPDGQYHESGYISGGGTISTSSECRSCSMGGKEGSQVFKTMPVLGPDGEYHESGEMPKEMN